ncbi:nuclease SbcCD subunit C [Biomphalaria pfeifferi]|uniref:Nuclease SbcCD subunit C n=1 Tax=Biomphalaria pfeifferi TaxID=112525 RepID=A0AAD8BEB4_BIOPF|nr:nuclease SbcCD subunit C [Biomphalaria pfeifferi]
MDPRKERTLLKYISTLWQRNVCQLLDLSDFMFFVDILKLIGQEKISLIKSLECRCMEVEIFLQEYFRSDISQWINFEKALNFNKQWDADIELAKISVVLIAIGVVSKSQHYFFDCALELPEIMHSDLMSMLMSCMQSGSYKLVLTSRIEQVLLDKSGSQDQLQHIYSPLNSRVTSLCLFRNDSPLRARAYKLKYNQDSMKSPLCQSGEPLYSVLSPSRNSQNESSMESSFIISIHGEEGKKDVTLSKLKQQLYDELCLKDELQCQLADLKSELRRKTSENLKLEEKMKELLYLRNMFDDFQGVELQLNEAKTYINELNKKIKHLQKCQELFQEQQLDINSLYEELNTLKIKTHSEKQLKLKLMELEENIRIKDAEIVFLEEENLMLRQCKDEEESLRESLEETLDLNKSLREQLKSLQEPWDGPAFKCSSNCGLPIYFDIQLAELKEELGNVKEEKCSLENQLGILKSEYQILRDQFDESLIETEMEKEHFLQTLQVKDQHISEMKNNLENLKTEIVASQVKIKDRELTISELKTALSVWEKHICFPCSNTQHRKNSNKKNLEMELAQSGTFKQGRAERKDNAAELKEETKYVSTEAESKETFDVTTFKQEIERVQLGELDDRIIHSSQTSMSLYSQVQPGCVSTSPVCGGVNEIMQPLDSWAYNLRTAENNSDIWDSGIEHNPISPRVDSHTTVLSHLSDNVLASKNTFCEALSTSWMDWAVNGMDSGLGLEDEGNDQSLVSLDGQDMPKELPPISLVMPVRLERSQCTPKISDKRSEFISKKGDKDPLKVTSQEKNVFYKLLKNISVALTQLKYLNQSSRRTKRLTYDLSSSRASCISSKLEHSPSRTSNVGISSKLEHSPSRALNVSISSKLEHSPSNEGISSKLEHSPSRTSNKGISPKSEHSPSNESISSKLEQSPSNEGISSKLDNSPSRTSNVDISSKLKNSTSRTSNEGISSKLEHSSSRALNVGISSKLEHSPSNESISSKLEHSPSRTSNEDISSNSEHSPSNEDISSKLEHSSTRTSSGETNSTLENALNKTFNKAVSPTLHHAPIRNSHECIYSRMEHSVNKVLTECHYKPDIRQERVKSSKVICDVKEVSKSFNPDHMKAHELCLIDLDSSSESLSVLGQCNTCISKTEDLTFHGLQTLAKVNAPAVKEMQAIVEVNAPACEEMQTSGNNVPAIEEVQTTVKINAPAIGELQTTFKINAPAIEELQTAVKINAPANEVQEVSQLSVQSDQIKVNLKRRESSQPKCKTQEKKKNRGKSVDYNDHSLIWPYWWVCFTGGWHP